MSNINQNHSHYSRVERVLNRLQERLSRLQGRLNVNPEKTTRLQSQIERLQSQVSSIQELQNNPNPAQAVMTNERLYRKYKHLF